MNRAFYGIRDEWENRREALNALAAVMGTCRDVMEEKVGFGLSLIIENEVELIDAAFKRIEAEEIPAETDERQPAAP